MSRYQFHVATSFLPTVGFPGRDTKIQVATSHIATHVATSKMMSRHRTFPQPKAHVATSKPRHDALKAKPGRNLKLMSRPAFASPIETPRLRRQTSRRQPSQVWTSKLCRDLKLSSLFHDVNSCHDQDKPAPASTMSRPQIDVET